MLEEITLLQDYKVNIMSIIKKTVSACFIAVSLAAMGTVAVAAEAVNSSSLNETIVNIEKALGEVNNSAFSEAYLHLKTARASGEQVTGDESIVSQAQATVIQGQIQVKKGNVKKSTDLLNKALSLYKSL